MKRTLIFVVMVIAALPLIASGQAARNGRTRGDGEEKKNGHQQKSARQSTPVALQPVIPLVDYHTHIYSLNASALNIEPLLPVIELPADFARLLRDKERLGGQDKDASALADLYTKDALVLNALAPAWLRGERAIRFVVDSTVMNRLLPMAYEESGSTGYIAGTEATVEGSSTQHLSNFLYVLRKGTDGKWRIASEVFTLTGPPVAKALTAEQLVKDLDAAGIKRGVVLSLAYWFGSAFRPAADDEYAKVRAENDWVAQQVARFPARLVGFCSFNPLKDYALEELDRCAKNPHLKGLKLHLGNSGVNIRKNPQHVEKVRQIFRAANEKKLPVVVHLWTDPAYEENGREHAEVFLKEILPAAPDITVQIAHMAGGGRSTDSALAVFADAITAGDPRTKNLYFDVATLTAGQSEEGLRKDAKRMRQIGLERILYGTDTAPPNPPAAQSWATFRTLMPLTEEEFRTIARNVAPYLR